MPYIVLARRYRPQSFEELVGQEHVVRVLQNAIKTGRIHHAYIFSGARGTGKTTTARIFAKALNCEQGPTPTPCNECAQCVAITEGRSVDVLEIDGASHTGVDNVRNLREELQYLPTSARYKVVIIDEVHMLSTAAFNALLKTLEEPPEHVIFILATTEPHKIPATIHSRCQHFEFRRLDTPLLASHLKSVLAKEGIEAEPEALRLIAIAGEGSVRDSLSIMDQVLAHHAGGTITSAEVQEVLGFVGHDVLRKMTSAILERDSSAVLTMVQEIFEGGHDLVTFTKQLVEYFRDLLVIKVHPHAEKLVAMPLEEIQEARTAIEPYGVRHIHVLFTRLFDAIKEVGMAHSQRTALELVLSEMVLAEPLYPAAELIRRIEALEKRLRSGTPRMPQGSGTPQGQGGAGPRPGHQAASVRREPAKIKVPEIPRPSPQRRAEQNSRESRASSKKSTGTVSDSSSVHRTRGKSSQPAPSHAVKGSQPPVTAGDRGNSIAPAVSSGAQVRPDELPDFDMWRRAVEGLDNMFHKGLLSTAKFRSGDYRSDGTLVFTLISSNQHMAGRLGAESDSASAELSRVLGRPVRINVEHVSYDQEDEAFSIRDIEERERSEEIRSMKNEALGNEVSQKLRSLGAVPVLFVPLPDGGFIRITEEEAR